jgi:methanogenic corrinoid protein MtbC1
MNASDKPTLFVNKLADLEEATVLAMVQARVQAGEDPFSILDDAQQALRLVGERYEQHEYFISSMMMAGEILREVMEIIEPLLVQKATGQASGKILLATVQGDIHDIGKNIFGVLLRCHGFTVTDLGVDVAPDQIVQAAQRIGPDIIALSGLLTISYDGMKETIQRIKKLEPPRWEHTPFIIGGGTVNAMVCAFVGADYWATDAMVGVQLCKQMLAERP